ncbi:MAG TPA: hypothetical protein DC000_02690 [Clostridiales bacterium]|nr:hypothetical protein [Clostridiales bacterium]
MEFSFDFNAFFNVLMTGAIAFITYTFKDNKKTNDKKHDKHEAAIKEIKDDLNRNFVTKEEHYRDINSLDKKIDDIKDILMGIKQDIGKLTGGKNG